MTQAEPTDEIGNGSVMDTPIARCRPDTPNRPWARRRHSAQANRSPEQPHVTQSGIGLPQGETLIDYLQMWEERKPDQTLYRFVDIEGRELEHYTYQSFEERTRELAAYLVDGGRAQAGRARAAGLPAGSGDGGGVLRLRAHRSDRRTGQPSFAHGV